MVRRFQFRLRTIFYVTTTAAFLCIIVPPIYRAVQRYLVPKRTQPIPLSVHVTWPPSASREAMTTIHLGSDGGLANDATFFQTNIIRVNGKRIDDGGATPTVMPKRATGNDHLP